MNSIALEPNFERNKNLKALGITVLICLLLFLLFLLTQWKLPTIPPPIVDAGIEVNLGSSETGLGDVAPQAIGEPSQNQNNSTPQATQPTTPTQTMDDKGDEEINATPKPVITKPIIKPSVPVVKAPVKPVVNPTPKPPTPKATFPGGTKNNGGNNSSVDNGFKNQGAAGGKGDQGNPNGNPNSDSYKGNNSSGNGINIKSGLTGRKIATRPSFTDEFTENAKVYVDVTVDVNGKVLTASVNPRGTTTTNANIRKIATTKAFQIKFTAGTEEQSGTIFFDFKVAN
jgi:outer membrane biosynthesis protein TonB